MDENVIKRYCVWEGHIADSFERRSWRSRGHMTNHVSLGGYDRSTALACVDLKVVNVERLETVGELMERLEAAKRGRAVLEHRARLEYAKREFEAAQRKLENLQRGIK